MEFDFIKTYFTEEKIESLLFIIIGIIAITSALVFWFIIKYSLYNGMAYPLLIVGLIQLTVGSIVYLKSDKDIERVEYYINHEPDNVKSIELPRMKMVMKNFTIYKIIEMVLLVCGLVLFFHKKTSSVHFWKGLGLGLILQTSIMLTLDIIAEKRGNHYSTQLIQVSSKH